MRQSKPALETGAGPQVRGWYTAGVVGAIGTMIRVRTHLVVFLMG